MEKIKKQLKIAEAVKLVIDCIFSAMLVASFCTCETWEPSRWLPLMALTLCIGLMSLLTKKIQKVLAKEYLKARKEFKAFIKRMVKNAELLTTDGLCSGPWDNATCLEEANEFVLTANIRGREYGSCVQAKNINEAIGIYLINNPECTFSDLTL